MLAGLVAYAGSDSEDDDENTSSARKNAFDASSKVPSTATTDKLHATNGSSVPNLSSSLDVSNAPSLQASLRVLPSPKILPASNQPSSNKRVLISAPRTDNFDDDIDDDTDAWLERKKRLAQASSLAQGSLAKKPNGLLSALPKPSAAGSAHRNRAVGGIVINAADASKNESHSARPSHLSSDFRVALEQNFGDDVSTVDRTVVRANDIIRNAERQTLDYLQQVMRAESPETTHAPIAIRTPDTNTLFLQPRPDFYDEEATADEQSDEAATASTTASAAPNTSRASQSMMIHGKCVEVVDVNADDHLIGTDKAVLMSLTGKGVRPAQPSTGWIKSVAPGARRKHQITYLAAQAKARESELQDHWATGRANKQSAAKKYGF